MKIKNVKLEWNVLWFDSNRKEITPLNIFYKGFNKEIHDYLIKIKNYSYKDVKYFITDWARYHYWSKYEYELFISNLDDRLIGKKIDIFNQIYLNIDRICEYVIKEMRIL